MAESTRSPVFSPDGKSWWDGEQWHPVPAKPSTGESSTPWVLAAIPSVVVLMVLLMDGGTGGRIVGWSGLGLASILVFFDRRALAAGGTHISAGWVGTFLLYIIWMPAYLRERSQKTGSTYAPLWVWIATVGLGCALLFAVLMQPADEDYNPWEPDVSGNESYLTYTSCDDIALDAVRISVEAQGFGQPVLIDVRALEISRDARQTFVLPTNGGQSVVLVCEGVGVWDNGEDSAVKLTLSVNASETPSVVYEPID